MTLQIDYSAKLEAAREIVRCEPVHAPGSSSARFYNPQASHVARFGRHGVLPNPLESSMFTFIKIRVTDLEALP